MKEIKLYLCDLKLVTTQMQVYCLPRSPWVFTKRRPKTQKPILESRGIEFYFCEMNSFFMESI